MKAEKLQVFIESLVSFFEQMKGNPPEVGTPYICDNKQAIAFDYSGVITITGRVEGCVYVSAETPMLRNILTTMGENDMSLALLKDLVGELANTISGNARKDFGEEFIISTPIVTDGKPSNIYLPNDRNIYMIPLVWNRHKAAIGISINNLPNKLD